MILASSGTTSPDLVTASGFDSTSSASSSVMALYIAFTTLEAWSHWGVPALMPSQETTDLMWKSLSPSNGST